MAEPLRVLVICTANICRSPAAEVLLRHHAMQAGIDLDVSSAGFLYDGEQASEMMAKVMGERGFDLDAHRSRLADCDMVAGADAVVTMERRHGRELAARCGPRGIFTLRGLVAALGDLDGGDGSARDRLIAVESARRPGDLLGDGPDEVADPFGKSIRVNRRTADDLDRLTEALAVLLAGESST
ncbi:MAG: hypothetical protein AAGC53_18985 [Actinomycetota bacterium]